MIELVKRLATDAAFLLGIGGTGLTTWMATESAPSWVRIVAPMVLLAATFWKSPAVRLPGSGS